MSFFKLLPFIWPFVKELILGKKTVAEAFKDNKKKVLLIGVIMGSFATNIFVIPKLISMASAHVILQREHEKLQTQFNELKNTSPIQGGKAVAGLEDPPRPPVHQEETSAHVSVSKPAQPSTSAQKDDRVKAMRKHLEELKRLEEKD